MGGGRERGTEGGREGRREGRRGVSKREGERKRKGERESKRGKVGGKKREGGEEIKLQHSQTIALKPVWPFTHYHLRVQLVITRPYLAYQIFLYLP